MALEPCGLSKDPKHSSKSLKVTQKKWIFLEVGEYIKQSLTLLPSFLVLKEVNSISEHPRNAWFSLMSWNNGQLCFYLKFRSYKSRSI
jgi:hypothetical protein